MISALYIESQLLGHPRVNALRQRFSRVPVIECDRYGEVFNSRAQNFRLQKDAPALILASRHAGHVQPAPEGYGAGEGRAYYFSHMLNCLYDCRYCFLQGMHSSAHYVLFVNYEDFGTGIDEVLASRNDTDPVWFNSGYDGDSLALEPVTGFADWFIPFFAERPQAILELRTKSTQVRSLLARNAVDNVVCAFSFTPEIISRYVEHKVPAFERRLNAMVELQRAGWPVGVRFEPLVWCDDWQSHYGEMIRQVLDAVDIDALDSVSIGSFRMPAEFFKKSRELYPEEALFAGPLTHDGQMVRYRDDVEQEMTDWCERAITARVPLERFYHCREATP